MMIDIQSRDQFKHWIRTQFHEKNMDHENSAVWIPEHDLDGVKCQWFVTTSCILQKKYFKVDYWLWCKENLKGPVRCFWSNPEEDQECWGFADRDDIFIWILRWL